MKKRLIAVLSALAMVCTGLSPVMSAEAAPKKTKSIGTTYYVSTVNGDDTNKGTSEDEAFYSLDKINEIELQPGDQVLLECGSIFENGYLHLQGSGSEEAPIVVDQYGEGNIPAINTNGQGIWYQNYGGQLDNASHKWHGYVSSSILLYDVEYIEIKNIEITNEAPDIETAYNAQDVMNRTGVAAVAQNIGTVDHVYLDNLYIHDVIGNVYDKHMNNGGIYFTAFQPKDASTGIAKYDDVQIQNCYVENTNRWGIAVGYSYTHSQFHGGVISDETIKTYGSTNVAIRNNYVKDAGGDSITLMYCDRPVVEYNVSDGAARQINTTDYSATGFGRVAAGIWPWKCKDAVFQYNEAFDTCQNQDGQAWDADYGDGTLYQYNYSHNNGGGSVMFCGAEAINNIFRYNISQNDLGGVINPAGQPDAHVYNNTFYVKEGIDFIRTNMGGGPMVVENNIIYYSGDTLKEEEWFKHTNTNSTRYDNNLYYNYSDTPSNDANAIIADPKFVDGGSAPTEALGVVAGAVNDAIVYDRDAFGGYKLQDDSPAINAGKEIEDNGGKDFFGNEIKGLPDIGAFESDVITASKDNKIKEAVYMIEDQVIYVPSVKNNTATVEEVKAGVEVAASASVEIRNADGTEVTEGDISDGMQFVIIAENGNENVFTIEVKNTYQWALDYAGPQQGNVWFGQIRSSETEYTDLTAYDPTYPNWVVDIYYGPGVDLPNHSTPTDENTHGLLSDTTGSSKKEGMAMAFRIPKSGKITLAVKDDEPYLRQAGNANGSVVLSFTKNGEVIGDTYTLEQSNVKADVGVRTLEVEQGDWIRVEVKNSGTPTKPSVHVTPIITYLDEEEVPAPDTEAPTAPSDVRAENISQTTADILWTASEDNEGVVRYEVYYGDTLLASAEDTNVSLDGLTAGTEYTLSVFAYDEAGNRSEAGTVTFTTESEIIEEELKVDVTTSNQNGAQMTNQDVKVTLSANKAIQDIEGWTRVSETVLEKIYSANGVYEVTVTDLEGNYIAVPYEVKGIDKVKPNVSVKGVEGQSGYFREINAIALHDTVGLKSVMINDTEIALGEKYYHFKQLDALRQGQNFVTLEDQAGNQTYITFHYDTIAPKFEWKVDNSKLEVSKVVQLVTTEEIDVSKLSIDGWEVKKSDNGTYVYEREFTENWKDKKFKVTDLAGNESEKKSVEVKRIDNAKPTGTFSQDITEWTKKDVTVTVKTSTDCATPDGWKKVNKRTFTKMITESGTYSVTLTSATGVVGDPQEFTVSNIDKEAPVILYDAISAAGGYSRTIEVNDGEEYTNNQLVKMFTKATWVTDNSGTAKFSVDTWGLKNGLDGYEPFTSKEAGTYKVRFYAKDAAGNQAAFDVFVKVVEKEVTDTEEITTTIHYTVFVEKEDTTDVIQDTYVYTGSEAGDMTFDLSMVKGLPEGYELAEGETGYRILKYGETTAFTFCLKK